MGRSCERFSLSFPQLRVDDAEFEEDVLVGHALLEEGKLVRAGVGDFNEVLLQFVQEFLDGGLVIEPRGLAVEPIGGEEVLGTRLIVAKVGRGRCWRVGPA